jgi:very-short-patch-repair endonuclease
MRSDEVRCVDGIPVSSVPRTLFDIAAITNRRQVEKAFNEVEVRGLTDRLSVPDLLARYPGRRGSATLKAILVEADQVRGVTREELEERFVTVLAGTDLPRPRRNVDLAVGGRFFEIDCLWPEQRLAVELDGRATHGTARAFEGDREKDRLLLVEGWRMVRITWRQLRDDAPAVVADLRRLLRQRAGAPTL